MSDNLKRLTKALKAATPDASPDARARALELAEKSFNAHQGTSPSNRHRNTGTTKGVGPFSGVKAMFQRFGLKPALYATSSIAVVAIGVVLVLPTTTFQLRLPGTGPVRTETSPPLAVIAPVDGNAPLALEKPLPAPRLAEEESYAAEAPLRALKRAADGTFTAGLAQPEEDAPYLQTPDRERFANKDENRVTVTLDAPVSTFSIDVDTASYAYVRASILGGRLPNPDAVRVEEMINYFPYDYAAPESGTHPFATSVAVFQTPWNKDTRLLHIGIQGEKPALENRPALNLVFLIDTSGSMHDPDKLPLLKQSFRLLLSRLGSEDRVSIVTYAGASGVVLPPTDASERTRILAALDNLEAGGATAGAEGLRLAYAQADQMKGEGRIGRILLATDGDFNVGISDPEQLKDYVARKRDSGTYLSVLGFGRGNYNDALMQALAQNGNGTASYIDTLNEAQKVLVDQVAGAMFPIAQDVKIQVEFNPAQIAEYRLIGYETRLLNREDFNNDKVDAGEIGAGHSVTALYEITPVGSPAVLSDPLRYQANPDAVQASQEYAFLKLRYKKPGEDTSRLISTPVNGDMANAPDDDARFAAAIAGFGQLLRHSTHLGNWRFDDAIALANTARGPDTFGYRAEAVKLMRLADSLSDD